MNETFEPGIVNRLQSQFPTINVHTLADEIELSHNVRNPTALLIAKTRQLAKIPTKSKPESKSGGFRRDGSWDPDSYGTGELTRFVWSLCKRRRFDASFTPKVAAELIAEKGYLEAFGVDTIMHWSTVKREPHPDLPNMIAAQAVDDEDSPFSEVELWPAVLCQTSAAQAVKHCGVGPTGHWEAQGLFVKNAPHA